MELNKRSKMAAEKNLSLNKYISIDKIAELKGLKSNRSIRIEINKPDSKYVSRKIKVKGGFTYEVLVSSLEPDLQSKLLDESIKSTQLIPLNTGATTFASEKSKLEALAKIDLIHALYKFREKFKTKQEADKQFLELYNSGEYLKKIFQTLGSISKSTLYRYIGFYIFFFIQDLFAQVFCGNIKQVRPYFTIVNVLTSGGFIG